MGRGWTSSRDLIGYYNPLTHSIEKTQPKFSACLETMTKEAATGLSDAMYLVLLDEANLSPIEHYWSEFNKISDDFGGKQIELSESTKYTVVDELRFVATINYDHTTEILSPRFLDRVWIVMMNSPNSKDLLDEKISTNYTEELEDIVSFQDLKSYFTIEGEGFQQKQISFFVKEVLNLIINEFHAAGHSINSRSILAIRNYCIVAEQYIQDEKQIVVDYAVAQKLLPCIEGNGPSYGEFLEKISKICRDHQLLKSEMIVNKIIANGKVEHNYFSYFNL